MSASVGNVVYPKQWLEVAPSELLRMFYNKRLMTSRSFSWKDLPNFYDEYDHISKVYFGEITLENKKEEFHNKRLFAVSHGKDITKPIKISFSHAALIAQIFANEQDAIKSMEKTGHYDKTQHDKIFERVARAKIWIKKYAPEEVKFELQKYVPLDANLTEKQKQALREAARLLKENDYDEKSLSAKLFDVLKNTEISTQDFFKAAYKVLLNKERGPKLASFIIALGKEKVIKLFESV